jgi:hypothetical protein
MSNRKKVLKKQKDAKITPESDNTKEEIDYLTEDPVISDQLFVCVSFLKPSSIAEKYRPADLSVCGFKVRGSYASYDEAKARADFLNKCDPYHNVYVAEVGKWCPFEDDPEKAKDSEYMNKDLNKLMKNYWKQQADAKEFHELRKQDMIKKALEEVNKKKEENAMNENAVDENATNENPDSQVELEHTKTAKKKKSKAAKLADMKSELETNKNDLERDKKEVDDNINTLRRLEQELAEKIKEMEQEQLHNLSLNTDDKSV